MSEQVPTTQISIISPDEVVGSLWTIVDAVPVRISCRWSAPPQAFEAGDDLAGVG